MAIDAGRPSELGEPQAADDRQVKPAKDKVPGEQADRSAKAAATLNLTEIASRLKQVETSLANLPVIDQRRVEGVLHALTNGAYTIDAERIASKIIAFEQALEDKSS